MQNDWIFYYFDYLILFWGTISKEEGGFVLAKEGGGFILKWNRHLNVVFAESGTC